MPLPASFHAAWLFLPALALAALLSTAVTVMMQVVMMWTVSPDGVLRIVPPIVIVLSGNLIPLPLLPDWLQPWLAAQPFRGLADTPLRIYSGDLTGPVAWSAMAWSLGWVVVLSLAGSWMMRRGLNRLAVAGG